MGELDPTVEQQLADMTDEDWHALTARVRAPDSRESLRDVAKRYVPEAALDMFVDTANLAAFTDDGAFSEAKAAQHLGRLFPQAAEQHREWGQFGGSPPGSAPGDAGRAEVQRRAEQRGQPGTSEGVEALRRMEGVAENAGAAEPRRRAACRNSTSTGGAVGAGGRAEAQRRGASNVREQ